MAVGNNPFGVRQIPSQGGNGVFLSSNIGTRGVTQRPAVTSNIDNSSRLLPNDIKFGSNICYNEKVGKKLDYSIDNYFNA